MITEIAKITGVSEEEILGRSRKQRISDARHLYFIVMLRNGFKNRDICRLNGVNHSTIIHGVNSFNGLLASGDSTVNLWYRMAKNIKR